LICLDQLLQVVTLLVLPQVPQKKAGLKEANQHFSKMMKAVREGEEVLLTESGEPLARIVPLRVRGKIDVAIGRLEASGFLRAAVKSEPMPDGKPRPIRGVPMVRTLREEPDSS
jgi:prevent-host-death family protein